MKTAVTPIRPLETTYAARSGWWLAGCGVSLAVLALGLTVTPAATWSGLLVGAMFGWSIALGALLLLAVGVSAGGRWWRPLADELASLGRAAPAPALILAVTLSLGLTTLYPWASGGPVSHLVHAKHTWLNVPFFLGRASLILITFLLAARAITSRLGATPAQVSRRAGVAFILLYATLGSVMFWDWLMSLEPEWYSTMFAVYGFAGLFLSGIAAVAARTALVALRGERSVSPKTLHDLGKLLFGFAFFWGYIWFCQFMLIWYANIPEEATHYVSRLSGGWGMLFWLNPILTFVAPFVVFLPARHKMRPAVLLEGSLLVLVGRWLDLYLLITPSATPNPEPPFYALAATLLVGAGMFWLARPKRVASPLAEPKS